MDTASKRRSAALEGFVLPSGTIDAAAREAAAWFYNGNAAGATPPAVGPSHTLVTVGDWVNCGMRYENMRHIYRVGR